MVPKLLIDGYNLLFESQFVGRGRGPGWLQRARGRLLRHLESRLSEAEQRSTQIIFDHHGLVEPDAAAEYPRMIDIRFATEYTEADELLEEIIRQHPTPKNLRVVSSDQRIRRCARARRAEDLPAADFLTELERQCNTACEESSEEDASQAQPLSQAEVDYWLKRFGPPEP